MIDVRTKLEVYQDDNGTFTDHSENAVDFSRDTFSMQLKTLSDYVYIGYRKPIGAIYVEIDTANSNVGTLSFQYYNGTTWAALGARDETKDFTRSGFITWDRPTDWAATEVDGTSKYWIRTKPSTDNTNVTFRGINLVFSDDSTLNGEFPGIADEAFYQGSETSHILQHVSARNQIIDQLRRLGYTKYNETTGTEMINQWELLDLYEVKQAAVCQTLSNIFFNMSDSPDDNWFNKHEHYSQRAQEILRGLALSVDTDDDGIKDSHEKMQKVKVTRFDY